MGEPAFTPDPEAHRCIWTCRVLCLFRLHLWLNGKCMCCKRTRTHISGGGGTAVFVLATLLAALFLAIELPTQLDYCNDTGIYLGGAASLALGRGYTLQQYENSPPISIYPPGQSAWLSLFWRLDRNPFPQNASTLVLGSWIAAMLALLALAWALYIQPECPTWFAAIVVALLGTSFMFAGFVGLLFADVLFFAVSFTAAALLRIGRTQDNRSWQWWLGLSTALGCLYLIKTAALAFIGAATLLWLFDRGWRKPISAVALFIPTTSAIGFWFLLSRLAPSYGSYISSRIVELGGMTGYLQFVSMQTADYFSGRWFVTALLNVPHQMDGAKLLAGVPLLSGLPAAAIGVCVIVCTVIGALKSKSLPESLFVSAYMVQLLAWPFYMDARGMVPLLPFIVRWLWIGSKPVRPLLIAVLVVNIPLNMWRTHIDTHVMQLTSTKRLADLGRLAEWLQLQYATRSIAAGRDVPTMHLTGMIGRPLLANASPTDDRDGFRDVAPEMQERAADYVVHGDWPIDKLELHNIQRVQSFGAWTIYRVRH